MLKDIINPVVRALDLKTCGPYLTTSPSPISAALWMGRRNRRPIVMRFSHPEDKGQPILPYMSFSCGNIGHGEM